MGQAFEKCGIEWVRARLSTSSRAGWASHKVSRPRRYPNPARIPLSAHGAAPSRGSNSRFFPPKLDVGYQEVPTCPTVSSRCCFGRPRDNSWCPEKANLCQGRVWTPKRSTANPRECTLARRTAANEGHAHSQGILPRKVPG